MTSSNAGLKKKSTCAPQRMREHRRPSKKLHTTIDPDITLVCFELITKNIMSNNYISELIQLKSLERCLRKDPNLEEQYSTTKTDNLSNSYIVAVKNCVYFKIDQPREGCLPHHLVYHPHKPGELRRVLNGTAEFHGHPLTSALLTGASPVAKPYSSAIPSPQVLVCSFC